MRGSVNERSPGVWRIRVDAGEDPVTRKRRQVSRTVHGDRAAADQALARLTTEISDGYAGPAKGTVAELLERWYTWAKPRLSPTTASGYRSKLDQYILPAIGALQLRALTTDRLDDLYVDLERAGGRHTSGPDKGLPRPLSPATVRQCHAVIRRACSMGMRWEILAKNPAELASPPSVRTEHEDLPEPTVVVELIDSAYDAGNIELAELAQTAVVTGARRGELCALQWAAVDLEGLEVRIRHTLVPDGDQLVLRPPKSGKPRRELIDAGTAEVLRARKLRAAERALACGVALSDEAYVFTDDPTGIAPRNPQLVTGRWRDHTRRHQVALRFHDLRHFSTTFLLAAGVPAKDVANRHGWSSTQMLFDVYSHATKAQDARSAELLGGLFRRRDVG